MYLAKQNEQAINHFHRDPQYGYFYEVKHNLRFQIRDGLKTFKGELVKVKSLTASKIPTSIMVCDVPSFFEHLNKTIDEYHPKRATLEYEPVRVHICIPERNVDAQGLIGANLLYYDDVGNCYYAKYIDEHIYGLRLLTRDLTKTKW